MVSSIYSGGNTIVNRSFRIKQHAKNKSANAGTKILLNTLNGLAIFINNINPVNTVKITHIVAYISTGKWYILYIPNVIIIFKITVSPVGIDLLITFPINFPFTRSLFGSNANINEGIPIHTNPIKLNWIGINGYGADVIINRMAKKVE